MALDEYQKNSWAPGTPITKDKMDTLEEGVYVNREALRAHQDTLDGLDSVISDKVRLGVSGVTSDATAGKNAWTQIVKLVGTDTLGNLKQDLDDFMAQYDAVDKEIKNTLGIIVDKNKKESYAYDTNNTVYKAIKALNDALGYNAGGDPVFGTKDAEDNTITVLSTMNDLSQNVQTVLNALSEAAPSPTYSSLANRLALMNTAINTATDAFTLAKTSSVYTTEADGAQQPTTFGSLDERLEHIEQEVVKNTTNVSALTGNVNDNYIKKEDVKNDFSSNNTDLPLSAAKGKELRDMIGGTYDSANTVTGAINKATSDAEKNAKDYADSLLGSDFSAIDTVSAAISGLKDTDKELKDADDALDARLKAAEKEIKDAHTSSTIKTDDADTEYESLDARLEAIESRAAASDTTAANIRTDLTKIATELAMLDEETNAIKDTNTKIDDLERDVRSFANELAMGRDENGALVETNTRVDQLSYAISHAASEGDTTTGLTERLTALEGSAATQTDLTALKNAIEDETSGLAAIKAIADANAAAISHAAEGDDKGGLTERITALENEPKSATEIVSALPETGDANKDYLLGPNEEGKYFYYKWIEDESENNWKLISGGSGGGGTGSSSAEILAELPAPSAADKNIDYYVGNSTTGYTHYRYIPSATEGEDGAFVSILPNNLVNSIAVNTINVTTADALGETAATVQQMSGGLTAYDIAHESNLLANFTALRYARIKRTYDGETLTKQELIFTDTNGNDMTPIEIVGGTGGGSAYSMRILGGNTFTVPASQTDVVNITPRPIINFGASLAEDIAITVAVTYKLSSANVWQNATIAIPQIKNNEAFTLNVASLLGAVGTETDIRVTASIYPDGEDADPMTANTTYHISRQEMSITALNYNPAAIRTGASFQFNYTCAGEGLQKIVYFKIDGTTVTEVDVGESHNETLSRVISLADVTTGMHSLQVYFVSGGIQSNIINTYLICNKDADRQAPIVGLAFDNTEINQGDELAINYTVYTPGDGVETTDKVIIEAYTMNGTVKNIVDSFELANVKNASAETQPIVNYPENENNEAYTLYVDIKAINNDDEALSDSESASIVIKPFASGYTLVPAGTENIVYQYNAYGKTNNSADKEQYNYTYTAHDANNTPITFATEFNNFNWSTDGYCGRSVTTTDDSGTAVTTLVHDALTISGGATVNIGVPILSSTVKGLVNGKETEIVNGLESDTDAYADPTQNGRTIELDFTIRSATDLNDVIIDCIGENGAGFQVTPQNCFLVKANPDLSKAVVRDDTGTILNENAIAAAYLSTGIRTHLVFVIEPWAAAKAYDQKYHQSVNIYINGEFANACPYNRDNSTGNIVDSFLTDATITIGKPSCIIDLYSVKLYNRGLSHTEVLQNYKMAPATRSERIARFEENDLIKGGVLNYELARKKFNCLLLVGPEPKWATNAQGQRYNEMPTISPYKGSPSPINRTKDGEVVGKTESGLIFTMPDGTVKEGYRTEFSLLDKMTDGGYASSNNVQGTSSQKYPTHNLKVYLAKGSGEPDENGLYAKSAKVKYKLPETGVKGKGESTLCWKADYMSTDHANTFNANIADSLFTDPMDPDWDDNWRDKLQYTVHGIRCLLFQQMGNSDPIFVGDGCLNNDKGNSKTYGLEYSKPENEEDIDPNAEYDVADTADTVAQKWEFTNNSDDLGFFKYDSLFLPIGNDKHYRALDAFESCWPDQGDLEDAQEAYKKEHDNVEDPALNPNYNHLQILLTWVAQRANYWNETDPEIRAAKQEIFKKEFTKHFILDHVLVYYLFSEYTALCDNRVKNMFMRSDTVRKEVIKLKDGNTLFEGNSNPNADFFKEFTQIDTGVVDSETGEPVYAYNMKNVDQIDWENSTFATWAPVLYDLDSCFGVENVGLLKIPYNADWQYQQNDQYLFNGHDSVFWLMFEDSFAAEIAEKASNSTATSGLYNKARGLNYNTFYQEQIVGNQAAIAPAMTNQDMLLKFDAPWATGFMNYANKPPTYETPEYKYLQRGSRATQKSAFLSKRSMLLSSKYQASAFRNDRISMRYGADVAMADAVIKLSGNQIFYPAVSFGDNKGWTQALELDDGTPVINGLVNPGEICRIRATSSAGGQDTLFIAGASVLTDVGDLSIFKAYEINISAAKNLKKIAFGSHADGYINAVTTSIGGLSSCPLLEEINIENCTAFQSLDLSANGLIKKVYTQGSGITSVSLPTGGVLDTLELGANTQNITLLNQTYLQNFVYENSANNHYANLRKLWIENTPNVPIVDIIINAIGNLTEGIRITGLDVNLGDDPTFLETITSNLAAGKYINSSGVKGGSSTTPPTITGRVTISTIRQSLYDTLTTMYPNLTINVVSEIIPEYTITYYDWDKTTVLYVDHKTSSERYIDPVKDINPITGTYYCPMPVRAADKQFIYYFGEYPSSATSYTVETYRRFTGWNKVVGGATSSVSNSEYVSGDTTIVAVYPTTELRTYTAEWYAETTDTNPIYSLSATYGTRIGDFLWPDDPGFVGDGSSSQMVRAKLVSNSYYRVFTGWDRPVGILTEDVKIYAQWENSYVSAATSSINFEDLTAADLYALSKVDASTRTNLLSSHLNLDTITVPLGNDFNYLYGTEATVLINQETALVGDEYEAIVYNGANNRAAIKPFETLHDFTLAIDYKPQLLSTLSSTANEYVIASCYKSTGSTIQGFKVSILNTNDNYKPVVVTWGSGSALNSTYAIIDYVELNSDATLNSIQYSRGYRNMVVLSYSAASPNLLTVYHAVPATNPGIYGNTITATTLTWQTTAFDAPLIFGGNYNYASSPVEIEVSNSRVPAAGIVYWAKYWDTDLGGQNCQKLAAWPHENLHFYLTGYNSHTSESNKEILTGTNLSFVTASVMGDRRFDASSISFSADNYASYDTSSFSTFYRNRLYAAFPTSYQSVMLSTSLNINTNLKSAENVVTVNSSNHYLFPPAENEVISTGRNSKVSEASRQWPWLTTSTLVKSGIVYELSGTSLTKATSISGIYPFLYRFNNYYVNSSTKIFNTGSRNPYNNGQPWTVANVGTVSLKSGDIWIRDTSTHEAYVYVSPEDIANGTVIDFTTSDTGRGGWKSAEAWMLRTYSEESQYQVYFHFTQVSANGEVQDVDLGTNSGRSSFGQYKGLMCEFAL